MSAHMRIRRWSSSPSLAQPLLRWWLAQKRLPNSWKRRRRSRSRQRLSGSISLLPHMKGLKETIRWYEDNAQNYAEGLNQHIPRDVVDMHVRHLKPGSHILEAGCGPGRETALFTEHSMQTTGID